MCVFDFLSSLFASAFSDWENAGFTGISNSPGVTSIKNKVRTSGEVSEPLVSKITFVFDFDLEDFGRAEKIVAYGIILKIY